MELSLPHNRAQVEWSKDQLQLEMSVAKPKMDVDVTKLGLFKLKFNLKNLEDRGVPPF